MSDKQSDGHGNLTYYIIGAIVAAIGAGFFIPEIAVKFKVGGEVFLSLLMMMVVPLVVSSVMSGILGLGDVRKLGKPGGVAVGYYMCTTVLAVTVGLIAVNILKPGVNKELAAAKEKWEDATGDEKVKAEEELNALKASIQKNLDDSASSNEEAAHAVEEENKRKDAAKNEEAAQERKQEAQAALVKAKEALAKDPEKESLQQQVIEAEANKDSADKAYAKAAAQRNAAGEEKTIWDILENILLMLVTDNLFKSAAEMSLLPLIVFSIIFAAMLTTMGDKVFAITRMINQVNAALMSFVMLLMNIAPIGIFCPWHPSLARLIRQVGRDGRATGVLHYHHPSGARLSHVRDVVFCLLVFHTQESDHVFQEYVAGCVDGVSTASSSATLPVTMECGGQGGDL